jgi:HTH-type transcriptional regulator, sugar sensing transcriptional regulator
MAASECIQSLLAFGFTELEAEVYVFLLQESSATGYRVAQAIGKPVANTYKAVESLHKKGAVLVDEGENRLCRAVPATELLAQLERGFQRHRKQAARALATLRGGQDDDRIYHLRSRAPVLERCHQMLARAEHLAVLDVFPDTLAEVRSALESTAARGIRVVIRAYAPATVAGADVFVEPRGSSVLKRWPGEWLNLVIDGQEFLLAFLDSDGAGLHQAVWSASAYLSWVYYSAVKSEISLGGLEQLLEKGATASELRQAAARYRSLFKTELPGYGKLLDRFGKRGRKNPGP